MADASNPIRWLQRWLLLLIVTIHWCEDFVVVAYLVGPNRLLGTCLDSAWVAQMESDLGVSSLDRDSSGRLVRPFLQPALKFPRYKIEDPRTASDQAYTDSCIPPSEKLYGANQDAEGTTQGEVDGTLVLDLSDWDSHTLASMVLAIIAEEVSGYKVSLVVGGPTAEVTQRMSSVKSGVCTPTHVNVEVWTPSTMSTLRVYFNESYKVGGVGYFGLSGLYTTHQFEQDGNSATPPYFPDFWKHYKSSDTVINALSVVPFKANPAYNPPNLNFCEDDFMGCKDNCERTEACTLREAAGKDCLVVALMVPGYDRGYFQAVLDNIDIPAYFCFLGYYGVNDYASDAAKSGTPVLFYHFEPDPFHVAHKGQIDRVFLPRTDPERVKLSTANYGENGYGKKTTNPVDVDFPSLQLTKFASLLLKELPIGSLVSKFTLSDTDINGLLSAYNTAVGDTSEPEPYFRAACNWVKSNYDVWSEWLDRLPLCAFEIHIASYVSGCENDSTVREIRFAWKEPNPGNASVPNNCDGGVAALPATIATSRSCEWISESRRIWSEWIDTKPTCDSTFYDYRVSDCDADTYRTVKYYWKIANATNPQLSAECENGVSLPSELKINCEYMPTSSSAFAAILVIAVIEMVLLAVALIAVYKYRDAPIIRRSQYEMLLLMIVGGFLTTGAAIAYAGRPTQALCGIRPVLLTLGFTTIFGALVIKSWRVYRIFLIPSMKRMKITVLQILKILSIFYIGDIVIFVAWFGADFPEPTITSKEAVEFRGTVDLTTCKSSSFIFSALLIFWKAILLMMGLYLSFLIRNVSTDFQEAPWIFGSVCVVLVGSLVMMPMSYLVDMSAAAYYVFLACALLLCTLFIMGLMLVPKAFRLKEVPTSSQGSTKSMVSVKSRNNLAVGTTNLTNMANMTNMTNATESNVTADGSRHSSQQKYQVKPVHNHNTATSD